MKVPLTNGRKDPSVGGKAMIKIGKQNSITNHGGGGSNTDSKKNENSRLVLIGSVLLSGSVFLNILLLLAACLVLFRFKGKARLV